MAASADGAIESAACHRQESAAIGTVLHRTGTDLPK
jgi:hypothetical protein